MKFSTKFGLKFGLLFMSAFLLYSCATTKTTEDDSFNAWVESAIKYYSTETVFHENPEDVQIISQDFDAFWQAVDASRKPDGSFDPKIFQQTYQTNKTGKLDAHSEFFYGTKERLYDSYGLIPFYESFRESMLENAQISKEVYVSYLKRVQEYYPQAKFPDLYLYVGQMRQGGTATPLGLLLTFETFQKDTGVDYSKFPVQNEEQRELLRKALGYLGKEHIDSLVVHEFMHFLQQTARKEGKTSSYSDSLLQSRNLLHTSLVEGAAEFLASVITNKSIFGGEQSPQSIYGKSREGELWQKFKKDAQSNRNRSDWVYNFGSRDRGEIPADMGYWMGFQIAKAYWDNMADKQQAFADILLWKDANEFLEKSGYDRLHSGSAQ